MYTGHSGGRKRDSYLDNTRTMKGESPWSGLGGSFQGGKIRRPKAKLPRDGGKYARRNVRERN